MLQEFDLEIKDHKGTENQVADHLSRLEEGNKESREPIRESFPDEQILAISQAQIPWYADIVNFLVTERLPPDMSKQQLKRFFHDVKSYY